MPLAFLELCQALGQFRPASTLSRYVEVLVSADHRFKCPDFAQFAGDPDGFLDRQRPPKVAISERRECWENEGLNAGGAYWNK
jgi:hypothetical protein